MPPAFRSLVFFCHYYNQPLFKRVKPIEVKMYFVRGRRKTVGLFPKISQFQIYFQVNA